MRRTLISIAYAVAGILLTVTLGVGAYAIAGSSVSEPARPLRFGDRNLVDPVQAETPSPKSSPSPEDGPSVDDHGGSDGDSSGSNSGSGSSNSGSGSSNSGSGSSGSGDDDEPDDD